MKEYKYTINGNKYTVTIGDIEENIAHVEVNGVPYTVEMEKAPAAPKKVVHPVVAAAAPAADYSRCLVHLDHCRCHLASGRYSLHPSVNPLEKENIKTERLSPAGIRRLKYRLKYLMSQSEQKRIQIVVCLNKCSVQRYIQMNYRPLRRQRFINTMRYAFSISTVFFSLNSA